MSKRNLGCMRCDFLTVNNGQYSCTNDNAYIKEYDALTGDVTCTNHIHPFKKNVDCLCPDYTPRQVKLSLVREE